MSEIEFQYDKDRAWQAVLWFANKHGGTIDLLKLVKLLFYADREHLVRYGRPITGGVYKALPYGPVAENVLADINASLTDDSMPFKREPGDLVSAKAKVDESLLSESDFEILEQIEKQFGHIGQFRLADMTHETQAYKKNFKEGSLSQAFPLPYEDFFLDVPKEQQDMLNIVKDDAEARACLGS